MISKECRAASRKSTIAMVIAIIAAIYATWYLPGLVLVLNRLAEQVERNSTPKVGLAPPKGLKAEQDSIAQAGDYAGHPRID